MEHFRHKCIRTVLYLQGFEYIFEDRTVYFLHKHEKNDENEKKLQEKKKKVEKTVECVVNLEWFSTFSSSFPFL